MCDTIYNRDTGEEIESQHQLWAFVGPAIYQQFEPEAPEELCLCDIDHQAMLTAAGYAWEPVNGNTMDITTYKLTP